MTERRMSGRLPPTKRCRGPPCGQMIVFVASERGNRQVVDPDPDPRGNLVVVWRRGKLRARVAGMLEQLDPGDLYLDHHATCPDADQFRGGPDGR